MGQLDVLSVGDGHLRLSITGAEDAEKAKRMIEDMLTRGFSIFVETDSGLRRVKKFNPKRLTYIIDDVPAEAAATSPRAGRRTPKREVPISKAKATAVGRTAGG